MRCSGGDFEVCVKANSNVGQRVLAAAMAVLGVCAAYGFLSPAQAVAVSGAVAAIATIWQAK